MGTVVRELVLADYLGTSVGAAVSHWMVHVHDGRTGAWARVIGGAVSFASTDRAATCELRLGDFDYAQDLESGARHAYEVDYRFAWTGADLIPLPGATFTRWGTGSGAEYRTRTPRTRMADLPARAGVLRGVAGEGDTLSLQIQFAEGTEVVAVVSGRNTLELGGSQTGMPGGYRRSGGIGEFIGRPLLLDADGNVWLE